MRNKTRPPSRSTNKAQPHDQSVKPPSQALPAARHARAASIRHKVTRAPRPIASERASMSVDRDHREHDGKLDSREA
jgi:hypothetical protein